MPTEELFHQLDANCDGELSRSDLHLAARRLNWHWYHAALYAVLDLLTIREPLSRGTFISYMQQISSDPNGLYGQVLLNSDFFANAAPAPGERSPSKNTTIPDRLAKDIYNGQDLPALLESIINKEAADIYRKVLKDIDETHISLDKASLLIIDPQCSFTSGVWMQSLGTNADKEVEPIRMAFHKGAQLLHKLRSRTETMFTRCPFPPTSYQWDENFRPLIDNRQFYFIKPGNSVMWPPSNGFRHWLESLLTYGKKILVMGGCTLNSCVRVSSIDVMNYFQDYRLQVVVDLSISGARAGNYIPSPQYGGRSSAASAINDMREAGVQVVRQVNWG